VWNAKAIRSIQVDSLTTEGYVVRLADGFAFDHFDASIAKWVRPHHVTTDQHWMHAAIVPNQLRDDG
jgi:hypothetical protein